MKTLICLSIKDQELMETVTAVAFGAQQYNFRISSSASLLKTMQQISQGTPAEELVQFVANSNGMFDVDIINDAVYIVHTAPAVSQNKWFKNEANYSSLTEIVEKVKACDDYVAEHASAKLAKVIEATLCSITD